MKIAAFLIAALKYIGIVLLILLAVIIVLLLIILLCNIKYYAGGSYKKDAAVGSGYATYLFGIVRADFNYNNGKLDYKVRAPFFKLDSSASPKPKKTNKKPEIKTVEAEQTADKRVVHAMSKDSGEAVKAEAEYNKVNASKPKQNKSFVDLIIQWFNIIKDKAVEIKNKVKALFCRDKKKKKPETLPQKLLRYYKEYDLKTLYKPLMRFLGRLFKAFGMSGEARANFGFDDPSVTGVVLGGLSAALAFIPIKVKLEPDFNEACFSADGCIKGKTTLLALVIPIIKMIMEKPVMSFIKKLKG